MFFRFSISQIFRFINKKRCDIILIVPTGIAKRPHHQLWIIPHQHVQASLFALYDDQNLANFVGNPSK